MDKNTTSSDVNPKPPAVSGKIARQNQQYSNKRLALTMLGLLLILIVLVAVAHVLMNKQKQVRSKKLVSNVAHIAKTTGCQDGLKQIGSVGSGLSTSSQYTNAAKESTLNYLVHCELLAGHVNQSLVYANQLDQLYKQDGNTQKRKENAQTITYIKSFEGP
jgi:hypothetical protein